MSSLPLRLLALASVASIVACSSSDDDTTAAGPASYQALAEAQCQRNERCTPLNLRVQFGDVAQCTSTFAIALNAQTGLAGLSVTAGQIDTCKASLASRACNDTSANPECDFRGSLADGVGCGVNAQCASGSCFYAATAAGVVSDCGKCTARAAEGTSCAKSACTAGLNCSTASAMCIVPVELGGVCIDSFDCSGTLECIGSKCVQPLAKGAECTALSAPCDGSQGLVCVLKTATTGACAEVGVVQVGQPCGFIEADSTVKACQRSGCATTGETNTGTCVAYLASGAACTPEGVPCDVGLGCRAGTCQLPDASVCK